MKKKNISLFKKIKLFREYRKIIKLNKTELETKFNIRVDDAYRLYTIINIPNDVIGEPYNFRRQDIDKFAESMIKEFSNSFSSYLDSKNLKEMYEFYEIKPTDKYAYLLVLGFSLPNNPFRSHEYYNFLYFRLYPIIGLTALISILMMIFL
jgi:hypothetical protein